MGPKQTEMCLLTTKTKNKAALDYACSTTVAGTNWDSPKEL